MLLPALAKAKQKALKTSCLNNQRQIALASVLYLGYSGDQFPPPGMMQDGSWLMTQFVWVGNRGTYGSYYQIDATMRYLNSYIGRYGPTSIVAVASCPAEKPSTTDYYVNYGSSYAANAAGSPAYNSLSIMDDPSQPTLSKKCCKGSDIRSPSRMVIMAEAAAYRIVWDGVDAAPEEYRHSRYPDPAWNLAFADGHSAFTRLTFNKPIITRYADSYSFDRNK